MRNNLFIPVVLLFAASLHAQAPGNFGTFNINEVSMTSYERDKQAEAVVLSDVGISYFTYDDTKGFEIIFENTTKVKIINKAGLKYADVEIPYYADRDGHEEVYEIEGYTYNLENNSARISKLNPENAFNETQANNWHHKKFAMPDVKEGSVIEYRYKIISPYIFNFRDWTFQSRIPTVYSQYTVKMIPLYEYTYVVQGTSKFDYFNKYLENVKKQVGSLEYQDNVFVMGMKNVPAFRDEEFISSINDYILKVDFQLSVIHHLNGGDEKVVTTWPQLIQNMMKTNEFGLYLKGVSKNAEDILATISLPADNNEKIKTLFNYVSGNYNWNKLTSKFAGKTVKEFLKLKTGNSADINLFLCGLLNASGLEAYPLLISTRDHGKIPGDVPFQQYLNNVIVLVKMDGKNVLLDATEPMSPFGMIPARCINEKGLIAAKEKAEWIPLSDEFGSAVADSLQISLNETIDSAMVSFACSSTGHQALAYRSDYLNDPEEFKKGLAKGNLELRGELSVKNEHDADQPFLYGYKGSLSVDHIGNKLLILPFPGLVYTENPLKLSYRNYPVDMIYRNKKSFHTEILIPPGYAYLDLNKKVNVDNELVNIQYVITPGSNSVFVDGSYEFKKAVYQNFEYYDLRSFMTQIAETFNDRIAFVQK